LQIVELET